MNGTIHDIRVLKNGKKLILYNDINTTKGQSGSPIYLIRDGIYIQIGIHVGYAHGSKVNIGTALTKEIDDWLIITA